MYLTPVLDKKKIICQIYLWLINFNLNQFVVNKSCSISGLLHSNPEKNRVKFCQFSSCTDRNSNVTTAPVNSVFLVTNFQDFTCDIPFCVRDMKE